MFVNIASVIERVRLQKLQRMHQLVLGFVLPPLSSALDDWRCLELWDSISFTACSAASSSSRMSSTCANETQRYRYRYTERQCLTKSRFWVRHKKQKLGMVSTGKVQHEWRCVAESCHLLYLTIQYDLVVDDAQNQRKPVDVQNQQYANQTV